jgi:ATP-dependent Zn protease
MLQFLSYIILLMVAITLLMPVIRLAVPDAETWTVFTTVLKAGLVGGMLIFLYVFLVSLRNLLVGAFIYTGIPKLVSSLRAKSPSSKRRAKRSEQRAWDGVVLPKDAKEELRTLQGILKDPKGYKKRWGQEPPLGLILHGPSGTGKTLIARTLARASGYSFIAAGPAELKDMWMGESEKRVRDLYEAARAASCSSTR